MRVKKERSILAAAIVAAAIAYGLPAERIGLSGNEAAGGGAGEGELYVASAKIGEDSVGGFEKVYRTEISPARRIERGSGKYLAEAEGGIMQDKPRDPLWPEQWGAMRIGTEEAWKSTTGTADVVIAIIDTGCDLDHPDLEGSLWVNEEERDGIEGVDDDGNGYIDDIHGYDFVSVPAEDVFPGEDPGPPDCEPYDFSGHGTHVAGIVAAAAGNGEGVEGVAPSCRLMILRAGYMSAEGSSLLRERDITEALGYAASMGADIVNMSFAGEGSPSLREAISEAVRAGVTVVSTAGNGGEGGVSYPGAYDETIAVAAVDLAGELAAFSGRGGWVDCSAPGVDIISTEPEGYGLRSGTSSAAPFVSGIAALVVSLHQDWTPFQVRAQIVFTCEEIFGPPYPEQYEGGRGLCRADIAVSARPLEILEIQSVGIDDEGGDGDGVADPEEDVCLTVSAVNSWGAIDGGIIRIESVSDYIEMTSSDETAVAHASAGELLETEAEFHVRRDVVPGSDAGLRLALTLEGETKYFPFKVLLKGKQRLVCRTVLIEELDGNGNGGADHGEKIRLEVEILNLGVKALSAAAELLPCEIGRGEGTDIFQLGDMESGDVKWAGFIFNIDGETDGGGLALVPIEVSSVGYEEKEEIAVWISYRGDEESGEEAAMLQNGPGHSGYYDEGPGMPIERCWTRDLEGEGSLRCQPVSQGGAVFVARAEEGKTAVYSLEAEDGALLWKTLLPGAVGFGPSSISWHKGVICASGGAALHGIDAEKGRIVWTWYPSVPEERDRFSVGNPAAAGGKIFATVHDRAAAGPDMICRLDQFTGKNEWTGYCMEGGCFNGDPPACFGDAVITADQAGGVTAWNSASGDLLWYSRAECAPAVPVAAFSSAVVVADVEGVVRCFDTRTGEIRWQRPTGASPSGPFCICEAEGSIWLPLRFPDSRALCLIESSNGEIVRLFEPDDLCTGLSMAGDFLYATSGNGSFALYDAEQGEGVGTEIKAWKDVRDGMSASIAFISKERAFVSFNGNGDDIVAAYRSVKVQTAAGGARLRGSYPNPFNPATRILFELPGECRISVRLYDAGGRLVKELAAGRYGAGNYGIDWDGKNDRGAVAAAGVYFCVLEAGGRLSSTKLVLLR